MKPAPDPKETQDFQFKQSSTRQICEALKTIPVACSLIVADGKRGLLYTAHENKITVCKCNEEPNVESKIDHDLPFTIVRLSVSCDFSYFGVTFNRSTVHIYNASSLSKATLELIHELQVSNFGQNVFAYDLRWNPTIPGMFCTIASDHSIGSYQIKDEQKPTVGLLALEKNPGLEAMCVAWSPRGKQLVIGCKNGNIIQLKPELKVARTILGPAPAIGEVIAILWLSNFQFCAAYMNANERRINVLIVDAPKGETKGIFTCYDDITYGMPEMEGYYAPRYYFDHVPEWNLIIAASSSSSEIAVLGSPDNGVNWEQWQLIDSGRAQLPLMRLDNKQTAETYPVGMTIDRSSSMILPWGPDSTLPHPVPQLHIFGTSGQIIGFHMVNLLPNAPIICTPPTEIVTLVPQSRVSMLPSEISFNIPSGLTSTPRAKPTAAPIDRPKVIPNTNLFADMRNIAATIAPPAPAPVAPVSTLPPTAVELKIPKPRIEKVEPPQQRIEKRLSPVKEISTPAPEKVELDDDTCWRAYREEMIHFENELKEKLEPKVWTVGTDEEKQRLVTQCAQIDEFCRELRDTTNSLSHEISYLKALLLQTFAWVEDAKSRNAPGARDMPRDRHDRSKILELQRMVSYTQSQLLQAMKALDMQWDEQRSQERTRIKTPSMEIIYQSLKKHADIIAKEKLTVEKLHKKWQTLSRGNKISSLNRSIAKLNISGNTSSSSAAGGVDAGGLELRCKTIAENTKKLSRLKQVILRDVLMETQPRIIKPVNPTPVQSRLEATLSSLASKSPLPAVTKQKVEKNPPQRSAVSEAPRTIAPAPAPAITKTTASTASPLASLNNIVAKLGSTAPEPVTPPQTKTTTMTFNMGAFPSMFGSSATPGLSSNLQFPLKPNVTGQSSVSPAQSSAVSPFPKVSSISFGTTEQKPQEISTSSITPIKDTSTKTVLSFEVKKPTSQAPPLFDTSALETSLNSAVTVPKAQQSAIAQNPTATSLGSSLSLSFKDPSPAATTKQQTVFSFASPVSTTATTTTTNATVGNSQTLSFVSKPIDAPDFTITMKETTPTTQPSRGGLDLTKMSIGLSTAAEKPASLPSSTSISFAKLTMPASMINSSKPSTPAVVSSSAQEVKSPITLPAGTSIEKVPVTPLAAVASPFGGNSALTPSIFGNSSTFGTSSTIPSFGTPTFGTPTTQSTDSSQDQTKTTTESKPIGSTSSIFSSTANAFLATSSASPTSSAPSGFTTGYNTGPATPTLNFGKLPTSPVSPVFGQVSASTTSPIAPASPFGQSAAMSTTNLVKPPLATSATTNFFAAPSSTTNTSPFGAIPTSSPSIFGSNLNAPGSTESTSIFGGSSATPAAPFGAPSGSIFGASSAKPTTNVFGGTPSFGQPPAAGSGFGTASAFGGAPAFGSKPIFGNTQSIFGSAKPEFNSPFGGTTFGSAPAFNAAPVMGGSPPPVDSTSMGKVFGSPGGTPGFDSLAGQNGGLSFDALAQKSPSPEKPPAFSGGSSFQSWR